MIKPFIFFIVFLFTPSIAYSYLGPGMGGGFIAATIGIFLAIVAALFGILWFPLKRFINKFKKKNSNQNEEKIKKIM